MNKIDKVVLDTDPAAATYRTNIKGWVSRTGRFYGDGAGAENAARYDGCTHHKCTRCNNITRKGRVFCDSCAEEEKLEAYHALEEKEWNEDGMIYSDAHDKFFSSWDEAEDFAYNQDEHLADLHLRICVPEYLRGLDPGDWEDELPEDVDFPDNIYAAIAEFNQAVEDHGPVSWRPGKYVAKIKR